jgi:hypothetical protein
MYLTVRIGSLGTQSSKLKNQIRDSCPEAHCPAVQKVMLTYLQKITFGEMRDFARADVLVYGRDHRCSHTETNADDVRLSDIEPKSTNLAALRQAARTFGHWNKKPAGGRGYR